MQAEDWVDTDHFYPPRDRTGAVIPHRLEVPGMLKACPAAMLGFFTGRVPPDYYSEDMDGETPIIVISCPCGNEPVLRWRLRSYSLAACECDRVFMHDGREIRVGREVVN